jgi:hypothetical protein
MKNKEIKRIEGGGANLERKGWKQMKKNPPHS